MAVEVHVAPDGELKLGELEGELGCELVGG